MYLSQIKKRWSYRSEVEKLDLIELSNERRIETFEIAKNKKSRGGSRKRKSSGKRKSSKRRSTKKTPDDILELLKGLSPEERKNMEQIMKLKADE